MDVQVYLTAIHEFHGQDTLSSVVLQGIIWDRMKQRQYGG